MLALVQSIIPLEWIIGVASAAIGAFFVWFAGRQAGIAKRQIDDLTKEVKAHETRNEVENRIATERDARKRLRDEWSE